MANSLDRRRERQKQAVRERQRQQYVRVGIFGTIVLAVLVAIGFFLAPVFTPRASGVTENGNGKVVNIR